MMESSDGALRDSGVDHQGASGGAEVLQLALGPSRDATSQVNFQGILDDWTGVSDPDRRKRLQNRLNQRAYRKRRRQQQDTGDSAAAQSTARPGPSSGLQRSPWTVLWSSPHRFILPETHKAVQEWQGRLTLEYLRGAPSVVHLPIVTQFNVFKALSANNSTLGFGEEWLLYEAVSPFNRHGPRSPAEEEELQRLPPHLRPTSTQLRVRHHPWIDLFPIPQMRDTVIRAQDIFDEDALACDLLSVDLGVRDAPCMAGEPDRPRRPRGAPRSSLFVWGDPTDPGSWEASVPFLRKWGWVLKGCDDIMRSTNRWREGRGERRLAFELS